METAAATTADPPAAETTLRPTPKNKPMGFLFYANGALKRHYPTAPAAASPPPVSYKECMRNHAASMGGHALDGCCEFMPSPVTFNPDDPSSLRCAACGCHRNFHRRDPDDPAPLHRHRPLAPAAHILMSTSLKTPSPAAKGKKRHRTKFSEAQKEKMRGFSERFGWKMQKIERRVVDEFCHEIGVGRQVLKVWMHNHKNGATSNGNGDLGRSLVHGGIGAHNGDVDVDVGGAGNGNGGGGGGGQSDHDDVVVSSGEGSSSPSSSSGFSI